MRSITVEIDIHDEISHLSDDDFDELLEWMFENRSGKTHNGLPILKYDPERAYRALQLLRKNEVKDALWELERAFL